MPDSDAGLLGAALMPSVLKAARIELGHRQVGEMQVDRKADTSPVTAADREAEAVLLEALASELPGVPVVAEERHSGALPYRPDRSTSWSIRWMARKTSFRAEVILRSTSASFRRAGRFSV